MKNKKGISLIVLIVTIIVVIILAAVVILTLSQNNPIESAKEARFKEDIRTFQDELALYISKQYANAGGHWDGNIRASKYDDIIKYIPSFTKKYEGKFVISNNNIEYTDSLDENEKEYAKSLNIVEKILPIEYTQVEFIESRGSQYIDTKFKPTNNTDFEIISKAIADGCENGSSQAWQNKSLILCSFASNKGVRAIYSNQHYFDYGMDKQLGVKFTKLKLTHDGLFYVNDMLVKTFTSSTIEGNYSIKLFLASYGNELGGKSGQISSVKIWDNNLLIRNFIPCYSTTTVTDVNEKECSKGTVGLYDTVEGKFYINQGTGEFIPGPEV